MKPNAAPIAVLLLSALLAPARAQTVELVAGGDTPGDGPIITPFGVDFPRAGGLLFVELNGHRLRRFGDGKVSTLVGDGEKGDRGDGGPGRAARLNGPHSLAIGPDGKVFIADTGLHRRHLEQPRPRVRPRGRHNLDPRRHGREGFFG